MWELYTFWAFIPVIFKTYDVLHQTELNIPFWSFTSIAVGGIACVLGGYLSQRIGVKKTASIALALSCCCCLLSPLFFLVPSPIIFIGIILFWGMAVIADSPLFSTLVAKNADSEIKGTALTIVNSIGFAITIVSIQLISFVQNSISGSWMYMLLAIGPILGLFHLTKSSK